MHLNGANTGFMLLAAALVMIMTPGLAFFYGGLVGRSNTLTIMIQSFASMGITTVMWWAVGYSLCFSGGSDGVFGNLHNAFLNHIGVNSIFDPGVGGAQIPFSVFIVYQMMFAIITPALITGAFTNRVTFKAYLIFLVVWQLFVYYPFVHMLWGGGWLEQWGARDFAGGIVVHASAGFAALASVIYLGKRRFVDTPHNIPFIALGTGLLWFGWYGFNAGSELKVDSVTALAFLNTDLAASFAAVTWLVVEWWFGKKPHFVGLLTGAVAGLATITPAAGYVPIYAAPIIGIAAGGVCYAAVQLKNRFKWDDALDVWGVHGVGGLLGIILLGVFARLVVNPNGGVGLIHGSSTFFWKQVAAGLGCSAYAFVFTYAMLAVIDLITKVRTGEEAERGLDEHMHGESAYGLDPAM
jgi:ammonium transporter, Amt family